MYLIKENYESKTTQLNVLLLADGFQLHHGLGIDSQLLSKLGIERVFVLHLEGVVAWFQSIQPFCSKRADMKWFGVNILVLIIWNVCAGI